MDEGVPEAELRKAKEFIKGRIQLRMEDTRAVSSWLGAQELLRNEVLTVDEILAAIEAITEDDLRRVSRDLLRPIERRVLAQRGTWLCPRCQRP